MLQLREEKKLTQAQVAAKISMGRSLYTHYELGDKNISVDNLKRICDGLEISVSDFFNHELFNSK